MFTVGSHQHYRFCKKRSSELHFCCDSIVGGHQNYIRYNGQSPKLQSFVLSTVPQRWEGSSKLQRFTLGMILQKKINQITEDKFAYNSTDRGHYIFIETSLPRRLGDTARLLSPILNANPRGACLRFWYHMYGPHINSLNVYTRPSLSGGTFGNLTKVWTKQHTQGNQWKFAEVAVASASQYQASSLRLYLPFLKAWARGIRHLKFVSIDKPAKNGRSHSWEERHIEICICVLCWKFVYVCVCACLVTYLRISIETDFFHLQHLMSGNTSLLFQFFGDFVTVFVLLGDLGIIF